MTGDVCKMSNMHLCLTRQNFKNQISWANTFTKEKQKQNVREKEKPYAACISAAKWQHGCTISVQLVDT